MPRTLGRLLSPAGATYPDAPTHEVGVLYAEEHDRVTYCAPAPDRALQVYELPAADAPEVVDLGIRIAVTTADGPAIGYITATANADGSLYTEARLKISMNTAAALFMLVGAQVMRHADLVTTPGLRDLLASVPSFEAESTPDAEFVAGVRYLALREPGESARGLCLLMLGLFEENDELRPPQDLFDFEQVAYVVRDLLPSRAHALARVATEHPEWRGIVARWDALVEAADEARAKGGLAGPGNHYVGDFFQRIQEALDVEHLDAGERP